MSVSSVRGASTVISLLGQTCHRVSQRVDSALLLPYDVEEESSHVVSAVAAVKDGPEGVLEPFSEHVDKEGKLWDVAEDELGVLVGHERGSAGG